MNNFLICNGVPLTEKDLECLAALKKMSYDEIDLSDIPETTPEEWERVRQRRLRKKNLQKNAG